MLRVVVLAVLAIFVAVPAEAQEEDWWYAESDHFRVYSAGGKEAASQMAIKLERVDLAMRVFFGIAPDEGPLPSVAKPTIFQYGKTEDIGKLAGQRGVAGFFIPRAGSSVAYVPLEDGGYKRRISRSGTRRGWDQLDFNIDPEIVLFHEYAHYFMFQHAPAAYPMWYIEGMAEVFGTLILQENGFALGAPPKHREGEIALVEVDLNQIFRKDDRDVDRIRYPYYGHGWLLTSYLSFHPERQGQMYAFLTELNKGTATREAAETAFGDLKKLEKELSAYRREQARMMSAEFPSLDEPDYTVRKLETDEAAIMPVVIQSQRGVDRSQAKQVLKEAHDIAARYPDSVAVKRALLEAEHDAGNYDVARDIANELKDHNEHGVFANLVLAQMALRYAEEDPAWLSTAREHFINANTLEPQEPNALTGYYLTFQLAGEQPPEDALIALEAAYSAAPFDNRIRLLLAHLLLLEERDRSAKAVLAPYINQPHSGERTAEIRDLVAKLDEGDRQPLIDELAPKLSDDEEAQSGG